MNATTQQYIHLIGSETETLSTAVALHLMDSTTSLFSIVMQSLALYFESRQLVKSVKANDVSTIIDPDDAMSDFLTACQEKIKSIYKKMDNFIAANSVSSLNKIMLPGSRWLLKKSFANYGLAIIYIMEHDVDADKSPCSEPFDSVDDLMKHLDS